MGSRYFRLPTSENVISIKKYLEMDGSQASPAALDTDTLFPPLLHSYRSLLLDVGKFGAKACSAVSSELSQNLQNLQSRLEVDIAPALIAETEKQVQQELAQWGSRAEEYFKSKANEIKELLIVLARTAEAIGQRDQRYAGHFSELTTQLQTIANLEDLTQVRSSLVRQAGELKTYVEQMAQDSRNSVEQLRAEVSTYESKLKVAEQLAQHDSLTGLANRRYVEERIEWLIAHQQIFCLVMVDLNGFKQINDTYGHVAGDNLLRQFAHELRSNTRSTDLVGRWGGDEFIIILDCDLAHAFIQTDRMQKWVFGEYTILTKQSSGETKIQVGASLGVAQWRNGETAQHLIERADAIMYESKAAAKKSSSAPDAAKKMSRVCSL